ncbi:MAG: hypothetical protein K6G11_08295 [Lachnospiraceae bacterium]|nr:hypothetical protein [Lachnospiraceae bacterium]
MDFKKDIEENVPDYTKNYKNPEPETIDETSNQTNSENVLRFKKTLKHFIYNECKWEKINRFVFSAKHSLPEDQTDTAIACCRGELFEEDIILLLVFDDDAEPDPDNPYLADVICGKGRTGMAFTENEIVYWENGRHVFSYKYVDIKSIDISTSAGEYGIGDENDYVEITTLKNESYMFGCATHNMYLKNVPKFYNFLMRVIKFKRDEMGNWEEYAEENQEKKEKKGCSKTAEDFKEFILSRDNSDIGAYVVSTEDSIGRFKEFYSINRRKIKEEDVLFIAVSYYDDYQGMEHGVYAYFTAEEMYIYRAFIDKSNKLKKLTSIKYKDILDVNTKTTEYSRTTDYKVFVVSSEFDEEIENYYKKMNNKYRKIDYNSSPMTGLFNSVLSSIDGEPANFNMGWNDENSSRIPSQDSYIEGDHGDMPVGGHLLYDFDYKYESEGLYNFIMDLIEFKEEN